MKRYNQIKKKYSSFLLNKLHLLQKRKCREYLKSGLSALQSNRISFYTTKKQESEKVKDFLKSKAISLMTIIASKIEKTKIKNYFTELKVRGQLKSKFTTFKTTHLFSRLSSLYTERLKQSFAKISLFGKKKLQSLRRISRIEKFIATKTKNNILTGFLKLRINVFQLKAKNEKEKEKEEKTVEEKVPVKPAPIQQNNDRENEA